MIFLGLNYDISRNVCTSLHVCVGGIVSSLYWVITSYLAPCVCVFLCLSLFISLTHDQTLNKHIHIRCVYSFTSGRENRSMEDRHSDPTLGQSEEERNDEGSRQKRQTDSVSHTLTDPWRV